MGIRNKKRQVRRRLDSKTLDARFIHEVQHGLNCSPFEAEAVLDVVKEIYFPFLDQQSIKAPPGKVTLIAVMQVGQIAFLLRRGKGLIQQYLDLLNECESDKNTSYHLQEMMRLGACSGGKKKASRRQNHL